MSPDDTKTMGEVGFGRKGQEFGMCCIQTTSDNRQLEFKTGV